MNLEKKLDTWIAQSDAKAARRDAERLHAKAEELADRDPEKASKLARKADRKLGKAETASHKAASGEAREAELSQWRSEHPQERQLNRHVPLTGTWPKAELGEMNGHPVAGAKAELFNANARSAYTVTRVEGALPTLGVSLLGRKNKGHAQVDISFTDGHTVSFEVQPNHLGNASAYVAALNAYASYLDSSQTPATAVSSPHAPQDIPALLRQLDDLRDAGIITAGEFDAKKSDLLARL